MNVKTYNQSGTEAGTIDLPESVFGLRWNEDLIHQSVVSEMSNRRQGTAHAKGRGEVRGGGRKPWRQKGTGRARHGSIRSPLWKGGGVTHGPKAERNFKKKINKKMAAKALATVLSAKMRDNEILILDEIRLSAPKTKEAKAILERLSGIKGFEALGSKSAMVVLSEYSKVIIRAFRNLPGVALEEARSITALDAMNHKYLVMPSGAIEVFKKRIASAPARKSAK